MVKDGKENIIIGASANEYVQKTGEAASQMIQALKGINVDSDGNLSEQVSRSLKDISKYKVNPNYEYSNLKQQAGFAGEVIKEARDNKNNILNGSKNRTRTTDGIGKVNDQVSDHVVLNERGEIIEGSQSQMKMLGKYSSDEEILKSSKNVLKKLTDDNWQKYKDGYVDVPSEQVEVIKKLAEEESKRLREVAKKFRESGNIDKARQLEEQANRCDNVKNKIRDSGVSSSEAMEARINPNKFVAKEVLKDSHNAGVEVAKSTFVVAGAISTAKNLYYVSTGEQSLDEAIKETSKEVISATGSAYIIGSTGTAVKAVMHTSSSQVLRNLGNTTAPTMIATAVLEVGKSLVKYGKGEIDEVELLAELGQKGTGMIGASYGATVGTIICPGIGSVVGGIIGYTVSTALYSGALKTLQDAKISAYRRAYIEKISEEAIKEMKLYETYLKESFEKEFNQRDVVFNNVLGGIKESFELNDINKLFDSAELLSKELGVNNKFKTFEEFDDFMNTEDSLIF